MIDLTSLSLKFLHKKRKTTLDRILNETTLKVSRHLLPKIDKLVSIKTTAYPTHRQLNKLLQQNLCFETPLFKGHLHAGDTKFGPSKMFTQSFYVLPLLKGQLYSGERGTFCGSPNPSLTSVQGTC